MKTNNKNKILININTNNISLILIFCSLILLIYYINLFILLITLLILKLTLKNNNFNYISWIKIIFISIFIYYYFHFYLISNVIYLDNTEYLILYNNIYIKGLNSLVENYGELIAYAVGVKLSSIYLKISPFEPTFFFSFWSRSRTYFRFNSSPRIICFTNRF